MRIGEEMQRLRQSAQTREYDPPGLFFPKAGNAANRQPRIVSTRRLRTDKDRIDLSAQLHRISPRIGTRQPRTFTRRTGQAAIEREAGFGDHPRRLGDDPFVESAIEPGTLLFKYSGNDFDTCRAQNLEAAPGVFRIRIDCTDHHAAKAVRTNRSATRRRAAMRRARLQSHVQRRAASSRRIFQ